MFKGVVLWPRVEQGKWILAKKNIITKKTNRQEESPEETKKTRKKSKPAFSTVFVCFLFFPWFWFSRLFFFVCSGFVLFFCQTLYSMCCWTHKGSPWATLIHNSMVCLRGTLLCPDASWGDVFFQTIPLHFPLLKLFFYFLNFLN